MIASWNTKRPTIISTIEAYWTRNLPAESGPDYRLPQAAGERDPYWPSAPVRLDPGVLRRVDELSQVWNVPRSSVITAACALLVRGWCAEGSEVVLDFPVSRRVRPESKTLPGMVAGVVPLVLRVSPGSAVAGFCEHVDMRIREALQHQRFPVHALERKAHPRGAGRPADRVSVNFLPSAFTLDFGGVAASASYTNFGPVGGFGLIFSGAGDELFLSTAGAGRPFSNFDVSDLARRLGRVLVAMTADPTRRLSSVDVLDAGEHARLDESGNRAVLTQPATPVSIPVLFAAQVARAPEAVAISCGGRSWTYRELEEAANRLAHLLAGQGVGPGAVCGAAVVRGPLRRSWRFWRCSRPGRRICRSTRRCRRPGSGSWSPMPRRSPRSPPPGWPTGWTGATCWSSMSTTPASTAYPAPHCRRRPPMTSPTSSTPRAPPVSPRGWRSPTTT